MINIERKSFFFRSYTLHYRVLGEGMPLVFLHGYECVSEIYVDFLSQIKNFQIFLIDLPGHSESEYFEFKDFRILADFVHEILKKEKIEKFHLLGHSMGGYIALQYLQQYPENVQKIYLLHSHPFADTSERKLRRRKEIDLLKKGYKQKLSSLAGSSNIAVENVVRLENEIAKLKLISAGINEKVNINYLSVMQNRLDKTKILLQFNGKVIVIYGKHETAFPINSIRELLPNIQTIEMQHSAHFSFWEEPDKLLDVLSNNF